MLSNEPSPIYIVSGGTGTSAGQLAHTVLVQFPDSQVPEITVASVRHMEQIEDVIAQASATGGIIVHTLVDTRLRNALTHIAKERSVVAIDLMGDLITRLSDMLGQEPLGHPGLYRQLHQAYFERVEAIEFSIAHDDGMNPQDCSLAEILLIGVSRVGKTPLSVYLSVLGWNVANTPLVLGLPEPPGLFQLDPRRVIGLDIEVGQLLVHRRQRQSRMGIQGPSDYTDSDKINKELEFARHVFQQGGFSVIDVTQKPIESSANEVIELITGKLKTGSRK